jgi:methylamine dehydrogenase accessory protein MauD
VILAARLVLFAVFAVAGAAKLRDREGSRAAARGFGAPGWVGALLPFAELAVAALLLPRATAMAGAIGAAVLLLAFIAAIAVAMARGEAPDCHCFGALHSEPAGAKTLARNGVLLVIAAAAIAAGPGPSAVGWIGNLQGTALALAIVATVAGVAIAVQSAFLLALLRQNGRILKRLDALEGDAPLPAWDDAGAGLPVGAPAPAFELPGLDGVPVSLDQLRAPGRPVLLLFTDPSCGPCNALLPEIAGWQRARRLTVAVVSRGGADANRAKAEEHGIATVLIQAEREVAEAYSCPATPTAVVVHADGTIAHPAAPGADAIHALLDAAAPALEVIPPRRELVDLDGARVELADRVLLFWNPQCGFCTAMLEDLRAWEQDVPELVLVSTGTAEENRAMGLRAPIVLDPGFTIAPAYGVAGTPSAVQLDAIGRAAGPPAIGGPAVLALAR